MGKRSEKDTLPIAELLGVEAAMLTNAERTTEAPVVFLTVRPEPHRTWQAVSVAISLAQAGRLRDDLTHLLEQLQRGEAMN